MSRRLPHLLTLLLMTATGAASAAPRLVQAPLDPATLRGAAVFTRAESFVAQAAKTAGQSFTAAPRPLPPRIILILDTDDGRIAQRGGIILWRGDMLPDQLAPDETGTLLRRKHQADGTWKTTRRRENVAPDWQTNLVPTARTVADISLPEMLIETAYHLGTAGDADASLVLWRRQEEDSAPIGGAIILHPSTPELAEALRSLIPAFSGRENWLSVFEALSP